MNIETGRETSTKFFLLVAGFGETGRVVAEQLGPQWDVGYIEINPELAQGDNVAEGDATSLLVLRRAGMERAKAVLAATRSDEVNLEFCRLAKAHFGIESRVAVISDLQNLDTFKAEGIEVIHRGSSLASSAASRLKTGTRAPENVGLGEGEICEVDVAPGSTAIGKTPAVLNPQSWLIAAIYRQQRLIVPHGDTVIEEGDRVLLVGQPEILKGVSNYFRAGTSEFPLQYGATVVGLLKGGFCEKTVDEVRYVSQNTEAAGYRIFTPSANNAGGEVEPRAFNPSGLSKFLDEVDSGCCVLPAPKRRWFHGLGLGARELFDLVEAHNEPVLIARGSHPYKKMVLGVRPGLGSRFAAEMAVDLARGLNCSITAVGVVPSELVTGTGYQKTIRECLAEVIRLGDVYGLQVEVSVLYGNPVHTLEEISQDHDLLVLAHRRKRRTTLIRPDVSRHLILRARCSTLCLTHNLPSSEESVGLSRSS